MSTTPRGPAATPDLRTTSWCWSHLADGGEAILSYDSPRGLTSLAVQYVVTGREISIPLGWFNQVGWRAAGAAARLEVSGPLSSHLRWVVRVTGTAQRRGPSGPRSFDHSPRTAPAGAPGHADRSAELSLLSSQVRGFFRAAPVRGGAPRAQEMSRVSST